MLTKVEEPGSEVEHKPPQAAMQVALLTGGIDRPYAYGLAMSLVAQSVQVDVLGSDAVDSREMHTTSNLNFVNVWPAKQKRPNSVDKAIRVVRHYASLLRYTATAQPRLFHILWNSKIQFVDRTLMMLYYKALGKRVMLTAHNVNQAKRDGNDSWFNRLTLRIQYLLCDNIFVHTQKMKDELASDFGVATNRITVIRHPINDAFPDTSLNPAQAKDLLALQPESKAILCLGRIKPYKGIEHLLAAFDQLLDRDGSYRLVIAGEVPKGNEKYLDELQQIVKDDGKRKCIRWDTRFIPDAEMEIYLKGADVLVLSYNDIFQSGILFLSYSFGLPVVAADVGSFREEIVEGFTGYLCKPADPGALADALGRYFESDLYRRLSVRRQEIKDYADVHHSWRAVAALTQSVYAGVSGSYAS